MLCFDTGSDRFNFRSVAVVIQDEHVLIHREISDNFWTLPGGRVEFFEPSAAAVVREINEELGLKCSVLRHLWHVESFFTFSDRNFHELANYYLVSLEFSSTINAEVDFEGIEQSVSLIYRWVPLINLETCNLKPDFLKTKLLDLPDSLEALYLNEIST